MAAERSVRITHKWKCPKCGQLYQFQQEDMRTGKVVWPDKIALLTHEIVCLNYKEGRVIDMNPKGVA